MLWNVSPFSVPVEPPLGIGVNKRNLRLWIKKEFAAILKGIYQHHCDVSNMAYQGDTRAAAVVNVVSRDKPCSHFWRECEFTSADCCTEVKPESSLLHTFSRDCAVNLVYIWKLGKEFRSLMMLEIWWQMPSICSLGHWASLGGWIREEENQNKWLLKLRLALS